MKKIILAAAVVITALSLGSCAKPQTCTCSYTYGGVTTSTSIVATSNTTDAKAWCAAIQAQGSSGETCAIK